MLDLLDSLFEFFDIYDRYGVKGCLIAVGGVILFIGVMIALAYMMG